MSTSPRFRGVVVMNVVALALGGALPPTAIAAPVGGQGSVAIPVQQALDPVAFILCTPEGTAEQKCEAFGNPPAYQVPSGRRLIVEQVSGSCGHDDEFGLPFRVQIVARTKGAVLEHAIIGVTRPDAPGGQVPLTLTRIYADPGSLVTIDLTEVPGKEGRFCRLTFSGQLLRP